MNAPGGRRALILMFTLVGILLVLSAIQENFIEEENEYEEEEEFSICDKMNLNISEKLGTK